MLNTNLCLWTSSLWLCKSSLVLYFLAFKICCLTNFSMQPRFFSHTSRSLHLSSKNWLLEQILLKRRAWLYGMDFCEWYTWQDVAWRYWWVSVNLTNTSVSNRLPSLIISTSEKPIHSLKYFEVNLMLGW